MTATAPSPKLSIITICYNAANSIESVIKSVRAQSFRDFEHLIIDGGSSDATMEIVERYRDGFSTVLSERDNGIGDAMNKGWRLAKGEYVLFLHADDYLLDDEALARAAPYLDGGEDVVAFDIYFEVGGEKLHRRPRGLTWYLNFKTGFWHQAAWMRRDLIERMGPYREDLRIAMDYEYFLRLARQGGSVKLVPGEDRIFSVMRDTGISSQLAWAQLEKRFAEEKRIHDLHVKGPIQKLTYALWWALYPHYRKMKESG